MPRRGRGGQAHGKWRGRTREGSGIDRLAHTIAGALDNDGAGVMEQAIEQTQFRDLVSASPAASAWEPPETGFAARRRSEGASVSSAKLSGFLRITGETLRAQ